MNPLKSCWHYLLLPVVLPTVLLANAVKAEELAEANKPVVTITNVQRTEIQEKVPLSGTLVPREEVFVNARVSGVSIQEILVDIGQFVIKGDVLIKLDEDTLQAQYLHSQAEVLSAEAAIRQAKNQIKMAEATLTHREASLRRSRSLSSSGAVPLETLDNNISQAVAAQATLASSLDGLADAQARLTQFRAQRDIAALDLSRATIKAPVDGLIVSRTARLGAIVNAGSEPLFTLIANGEIEIQADVIETSLIGINAGDRADVRIAGLGRSRAVIRLVSPKVDPVTRLGSVMLSLEPNTGHRIGTFAHGWIVADSKEALVVPSSAVHSMAQGEFVTVVKNNTIEKRRVKAGLLYEGNREIESGLVLGEQILVRAGSFFRDGDLVKTISDSNTDTALLAQSTQTVVDGEKR